jgi:NAD+ kinase
MRRVGLIAREDRPDAADVVRQLCGWLRARGCRVVVDAGTGAIAGEGVEVARGPEWPKDVDLVVVLGGDGTLLAAVRLVGRLGVPILGVNLGRLGFLTATTLEELYPTLVRVLAGDVTAEERMVLAAAVIRDGHVLGEYLALNDVVISKGAAGRLIELEVSADGQLMTAYRADGLIIATPTGSTAYNLSADGPILFPTMDALVLTPICSHALTDRPIVLPATIALEVRLPAERTEVALWLDGQLAPLLTGKDVVRIRRADARIRLVRDPEKTYFQVLRTKLKWGER